jgi:bifunctional DNA-binding transcriptional regulator/antitoxin component of YhaV-PrlF toxin-antitoxin module
VCVAAAHVRYVRRGTCLVAVALVMAPRQTTLEYLTTTKIGEKGELTVPKQFRKDLGLGTGAPSAVLRLGDGRVLLPEQQLFEHLCEQVGSALTRVGVTPEALLASLPEARKRVYARHYGKSSPSRKTSRRLSRRRVK